MKTFIPILLVALVGISITAAEPVVNADVCLNAVVKSSSEQQLLKIVLILTKIISIQSHNVPLYDYVKEALCKSVPSSLIIQLAANVDSIVDTLFSNLSFDLPNVAANLVTGLTGGLPLKDGGNLGSYFSGAVDAAGLAKVASNGLLQLG